MRKNTRLVRYISRAAAVAAMYVVLTLLAGILGFSSGPVQFRISEALCVLPIFMPSASVGLFIGCMMSNLIVSGGVIWDVIFGGAATLIGALGARALRSLPEKFIWLATLPTVVANALIIPPVLIFAYGAVESYLLILVSVTVGEIFSASIGGTWLYFKLKRSKINLN